MPGRIFLWLLLSGSVHDRFAALIHALSARLGTPPFLPHITLCGSIDLPLDDAASRVADLATQLAPIRLQLTEVDWIDEFYRCLFIRAEPDRPLRMIHQAACSALGRPPEGDFMPHLSLVYGNLTSDQKTHIVGDIGRRFDVTTEASRVGLCLATGGPENWRVARTYVLAG